MNTGVAKAGLGIKRPLVGTETLWNACYNSAQFKLGIKRPLVGTETLWCLELSDFILGELGIKRPLVGTETFISSLSIVV